MVRLSAAGPSLLLELTRGDVEENTALLSFLGTNTLQMLPSQQDEHTWGGGQTGQLTRRTEAARVASSPPTW